MKILLLAEACNPEWTSVPLVGFNLVNALSQRSDLHITLATHIRNRPALERDGLASRMEIVWIDNEWIAKPFYRMGKLLRGGSSLGWTTNMAFSWPAYVAFEMSVASRLKRRLESGEFDLIHRITPVSPTLPSPLSAKAPVPMIVGPLNGGLPWPKEFPKLQSSEREWLSPLRRLSRQLPGFRSTYQHLAGVISGSRHTANEIPEYFRGKQFHLPENGIDPLKFPIASDWTEPAGRFRFISTGRLVPYKGFDLILDAMARSPLLRTCHLQIVGDGPRRKDLEEKCHQLGLSDVVNFHGWLPQQQVSELLSASQAFVFPSLREFGGAVVLEAMASGLPAIVMNYGGPAELIDDTTGIRLPMGCRSDVVTHLTAAMESLATNPSRCRSMARHGIQCVLDHYTWDRKADALCEIYSQLTPDAVPSRSLLRPSLERSNGPKHRKPQMNSQPL
jgi:glycosyltransferase involved in cell wall biosynthesis